MKHRLIIFLSFSLVSTNLYTMPWYSCSSSEESASKKPDKRTVQKKEHTEEKKSQALEKEVLSLQKENKKLILINALLQHENDMAHATNKKLQTQLEKEIRRLESIEGVLLKSLEEHHVALHKKTYRPSSRVPTTINTNFTQTEKKFKKDWEKSGGIGKPQNPRVLAIKTGAL